ncbi:MAG: peptide MFS transporter [Desulfomonile tiedjei]|uniref:Peptide MFS transporter n=1 Tax=Desulfomonile tiedjei TaxID=2358 RepID=A0A9D6V1A8_9BACT|nr:peptide MFS transporter [Desulfomonile tiedjei]
MHAQDLWGHPKGLYVLFLTEMWERFSYYGMRALLVYYMIKHLAFSQGHASQIYGLYTGLVYLTPLFGGILADRRLGQRKSVILGGVLMAIGHFMMASEFLFFPALLFLILGNGAFKPNISTQVGSLYPPGDPRRDRAFSIFYVGINLGAFFSPLICGTLGERLGWHYGFGAAGIGMILGLLIYLFGNRWLAPDIMAGIAPEEKEADSVLETEEKNRIFALMAMCLVSIAFWAVYEQQGNTIALWADANTDRDILGWVFPASWFQALNPAFVFTCTPIITTLWTWQSRRRKEPSAIGKMAIGCLLLSAGFVVMIPAGMLHASSGAPASILWLVAFTLLVTIGELYLSPVGLSLVTKLAPARMVSMMMGVWFLSSFVGNGASGLLGNYWEKIPKEAFFLIMAAIALAAGLIILVMIKPIKRAIGTDQCK